jgi:hypothetical protein
MFSNDSGSTEVPPCTMSTLMVSKQVMWMITEFKVVPDVGIGVGFVSVECHWVLVGLPDPVLLELV